MNTRCKRNPPRPDALAAAMTEPDFDCLIIGGGPAGLTAAIYLTRFHLSIKLVDAGKQPGGPDPLHPQPCRLSRRHFRARS